MGATPGRRHYFLLFIVSLSLLMQEIALARVLSVALFSHFAFVAVSLAMFGLGLSGLVVYLLPAHFRADRLDRQVPSYAAAFGVAAVLCTLAFLRIRVVQEISLEGFLTLGAAYAVLAVPFFLGGVCVSLLMTHLSAWIDRIYFADLVGASFGCLGVVIAMEFMPAPEVPLVVGALATGAALLVSVQGTWQRKIWPAIALLLVLLSLAVNANGDLFRMRYVKIWSLADRGELELWNAFSRVSVIHSPGNAAQTLPLKDPAVAYDDPAFPDAKMLDIDGTAWTPMIQFDGDLGRLDFLRGSVLYAVHTLRPGADVLIVGTGGGRDVLAAKVFGQPSVLGIELNPLMWEIVQERQGDYSGRPYTLDGVEVVLDEARSRLHSLDRSFDVIQLSFIDTFALNAAGGFVFTENYLYTTESFREFFRLLRPDGVLSVSRYVAARYPLEVLKTVAMVRAAWEEEGVADVAAHVVVLYQNVSATLLAKRTPYTQDELQRIAVLARQNNMTIAYQPGGPAGPGSLGPLLTTTDFHGFLAAYPFIIDPPTDDRPFFFNFLRGRLADGDVPDKQSDPFQFMKQWQEALLLLYMLVAVVGVLAVIFFFVPLLLLGRRRGRTVPLRTVVPLLLYFACLGYGFMMIEIPLLQRLMLFLGYPVYALAVVLFSLLLFSGIGSLLCLRLGPRPERTLPWVLAAIVVVAAIYALALPAIIGALLGSPIIVRIAATVALLAPIGLLLGAPYPLGVTILRTFDESFVPWAWSLNSVLSVVASVGAIVLGSRVGFTAAFSTGIAAYAVGLLAMGLVLSARRPRAS